MLKEIQQMVNAGFRTEHGHEIFDVSTEKERYPEIFNEKGEKDWDKYDEIVVNNHPIRVYFDKDMISFKMMSRPVSEGGSGVQWNEAIEVFVEILRFLNNKFPCRENEQAIAKFEEGLMWNRARTRRRQEAGIEGYDKEEPGA